VYDDWGFRQKMSRGLGISVLFAGASGTGKTMAAEVIAKELDLNLYRIDLSAVISKYIGETEKNLRKVFDAAEDGGTLLFFDEADALFGKRSEVKDSHDRFANTQVADLLQRMENYSGLAILATNMKSALDPAFLRRLRFIVNFTFPGAAERRLIWQKAFTGKVFKPGTEYGDLDFDRLSQFNLTGGNIHSIALNAAFLAAQGNEYLNMLHVINAVRTEFNKLDKPINETEFRVMEVSARKLIWQKAFADKEFNPGNKYDDLDFDRLAQLKLTARSINNIVFDSAHLAEQNNEDITMRHVMQSVCTEFRKLDKPINEAEFRMIEVVDGNA
jgi:SpoVK/Ycf46/Vps4 family AAA+-type ATPase